MRIPFREVPAPPWRCPALHAVFGIVVLAAATLHADEPPRPPSGQLRLAGGRDVAWTVHFDRNSIRESLRVDRGLIALTSSGALLRFELPGMRLGRERIDTEAEITCLGHGEGGRALAGLADGRICRIDPMTFELTDAARLPAAPRWIAWRPAVGGRPAGLVAVTWTTRPMNRRGERWDQPIGSVVHDLATGKTFPLKELATTHLLDGAGRVWLGVDKGEWGGQVMRVDLVRQAVAAVEPPPSREPGEKASWHGVYGFLALRDGQVWAFGGTSHMGYDAGFVTRIDEAQPRTLAEFDRPPLEAPKEPDRDRPSMPITHIVEEDGGLFVFSYSDVFRVDKALRSWKRAATLEIRYRFGRPNAVGSFPSINTVHRPARAGEPWVLATVSDGYVLLEGTKARSHALPGQLGASGVDRVLGSAEGILALESDDRLPPWTLGAGGWEVAALAPPLEPDPANDLGDFEKKDGEWYETQVLVGPDGAVTTVNATSVSPGTRTTARRVGGKSVRLGRETSSLDPSSTFVTADGALWNASFGELLRLEDGRWKPVASLPRDGSPSDLTPVSTHGPPWILHAPSDGTLWRLAHGPRGDNPRLTGLAVREGGSTLAVRAAIPWSDQTLLVATAAGLRSYDPVAERLTKVDLEGIRGPVRALSRDRLGRLWLGGEHGLWMVDAGGKAAESLERVPWVRQATVRALAPDPHHDDGVLAALDERGVAFVRAMPKP